MLAERTHRVSRAGAEIPTRKAFYEPEKARWARKYAESPMWRCVVVAAEGLAVDEEERGDDAGRLLNGGDIERRHAQQDHGWQRDAPDAVAHLSIVGVALDGRRATI